MAKAIENHKEPVQLLEQLRQALQTCLALPQFGSYRLTSDEMLLVEKTTTAEALTLCLLSTNDKNDAPQKQNVYYLQMELNKFKKKNTKPKNNLLDGINQLLFSSPLCSQIIFHQIHVQLGDSQCGLFVNMNLHNNNNNENNLTLLHKSTS
ncbi:hypothetical protein RFI_40425 [Reticulomyxa filosa]|uniref:Uncharacterized protein n=1 Tax=Reticulomyxa filosa TaxID=46433 RepID=X6L749_RETFI|nr:hypothetical protein RFI_40425 [Reticulomyxa filosa]|eukprot:ETN97105.1 hypothetical protein RFI_40425 [Reticulomyxa filosa]